ncbi:hypothetical protein KI387_009255, partial [Taxus chinensis]
IDNLLDDWEISELVVEVVAVVGIAGLYVGGAVVVLVDGLIGEGEVGIVVDALT